MSRPEEASASMKSTNGSGRPRRWRKLARRLGIGGAVLLVLLVVGAAGTEYYTSRPSFCGSCHIMDRYYRSWANDVHSGSAGGEAICVDCHYAPGEQHTFKAKFRGLSQAASYFSGRANGGRPRAQVVDASCLNSHCHDDRKFMTDSIELHDVGFVHATHLDPASSLPAEQRKRLGEVRERLTTALGAQRFALVDQQCRSLKSGQEKGSEPARWVEEQGLADSGDDIAAYAELVRVELRLDQLSRLQCRSCHVFDQSRKSHFVVDRTACYICHFAGQPFNAGTGRCMSCHEPPTAQVLIHAGNGAQAPHARTPVTMDHTTIIANNVSCSSCHADVVRGSGAVSRQDCRKCHDADEALQGFDHLTTEVVREYHRLHQEGQHARCEDCHQAIQHDLVAPGEGADLATLLSPVRADCQHCHPDHHHEQVDLLLGRGGFTGGSAGVPNPMAGCRTNCQACHVEPGADAKGGSVVTATRESCRGCHSEDYEKLFEQWQRSIGERLKESQELLAQVEGQLQAGTQPAEGAAGEAARLVERARKNIQLIAAANGLHNKHYTLMVLEQAVADLKKASGKASR